MRCGGWSGVRPTPCSPCSRWRSAPAAPPPSSASSARCCSSRCRSRAKSRSACSGSPAPGTSRSSSTCGRTSRAFERMAAYRPDNATLETAGGPAAAGRGRGRVRGTLRRARRARRCSAARSSAGDDAAGAEPSTVLSHALWQELGSDPSIVGKPLRLGGVYAHGRRCHAARLLVPEPRDADRGTATPLDPAEPLRPLLAGRPGRPTACRSSTWRDRSRAIAHALGARFRYPAAMGQDEESERSRRRASIFVGDVRPSLVATLAAMGVILLIACANVAALMLGQVDARATELAVRSALGANRQRLIQQLVIESLVDRPPRRCDRRGAGDRSASRCWCSRCRSARSPRTRVSTGRCSGRRCSRRWSRRSLIAIVPGAALWRGSSLQSTMATTRTGGIAGPRRTARRWAGGGADGAGRPAGRRRRTADPQRRQPARDRSGYRTRATRWSSTPRCRPG